MADNRIEIDVQVPGYGISFDVETGRFFASHEGDPIGWSEKLTEARDLVRKHVTGSSEIARRKPLDIKGLLVKVSGARTSVRWVTLKGMDSRSGRWRFMWHKAAGKDPEPFTTERHDSHWFIPHDSPEDIETVTNLVQNIQTLEKQKTEAENTLTGYSRRRGFELRTSTYGKPSPETVMREEGAIAILAEATKRTRPPA